MSNYEGIKHTEVYKGYTIAVDEKESGWEVWSIFPEKNVWEKVLDIRNPGLSLGKAIKEAQAEVDEWDAYPGT